MLKKADKTIRIAYYVFFVICTGVMIFEMPSAVFWSPVILFALYLFFCIVNKTELNISLSLLLFAAFAVSYIYFCYKDTSGLYYQSYVHFHALIYLFIGYNLFSQNSLKHSTKLFEGAVICIAVLFSVYAVITLTVHKAKGLNDIDARYFHSLWYSNVIKAATGLCVSFAIPAAYGIYCLFCKNIFKKLLGCIFISISVAFNMYTGTRALVFFIPVMIFAAFFIFFLINKKNYIGLSVFLCLLLSAALVAVYLFFMNYEQILNYVSTTPFKRYFITDNSIDSRIYYSFNVINNFSLSYMGGAVNTNTVGMPHNMWLYIYDYGGIVPFILFSLFTAKVLSDYIVLLFRKSITFNTKLMFSMLLIVVFLEFMNDAFILPVPSFYIIAMFIAGSLGGITHCTKRVKKV